MMTEPKIEYREEVPYLAIPARLPMKEIPQVLPPLIPEIYARLAHKGILPAGPLFFHYTRLMSGLIDVEVGVPIGFPHAGDDRLRPGLFPGGHYAVCTHQGDFKKLPEAHAAIEAWKAKQGLPFAGERTEFYPVGPDTEPDPEKWQTDIFIHILN